MNANLLTLISELAFGAPFLAIAAIFIHYCVRRASWKRKKKGAEKTIRAFVLLPRHSE